MTRSHLGFAFAIALATVATPALAGVSADINLHVGDPPAPVVVFDREPDVVLVPNTRVYCVGGLDYDLFRYGQYWYINNGGYWYRARNYRGPFGEIRYESVPRPIMFVPARYHRHPMHPLGGPPGQMKKQQAVYRDASDDGVTIIRGKEKSHGNEGNQGNQGNRGKH
jgi:hypothetical protein